ncbi:MAG: dihydrodipicolinate reductase C-terminal domain-containing protein, partial [Pseudomonadota bacterium]
RDAPSGTALLLADALQPDQQVKHGRSGVDCVRESNEIAIHAVRGGDVIGEHAVHFLGLGERIELAHRATDRSLFARGALRAARWLIDQPAGLYSVQNLLNTPAG